MLCNVTNVQRYTNLRAVDMKKLQDWHKHCIFVINWDNKVIFAL